MKYQDYRFSVAPMMDGAAVRNAAPAAAETVRWRAWGAPAAAFVAGGIIGGALAAPYYYDYGYGPYYPGPYYGGPYAAAPAMMRAGMKRTACSGSSPMIPRPGPIWDMKVGAIRAGDRRE